MLDRIDLQVDVPPVRVSDLNTNQSGESSETVAARIMLARKIQENRFIEIGADLSININAHADNKTVEAIAPLDNEAKTLLNKAMESTKLSARGYYRILRVARTIADLAGAPRKIEKIHIAEALSYRRIQLR